MTDWSEVNTECCFLLGKDFVHSLSRNFTHDENDISANLHKHTSAYESNKKLNRHQMGSISAFLIVPMVWPPSKALGHDGLGAQAEAESLFLAYRFLIHMQISAYRGQAQHALAFLWRTMAFQTDLSKLEKVERFWRLKDCMEVVCDAGHPVRRSF